MEHYILRQLCIGNQTPCVYLAIDEAYQREGKGISPLVKVGLTKRMGRRRSEVYQAYHVRTVCEIPTLGKYLRQIEVDLITWLHSVPTSHYESPETAYVDAAVVDLMIKSFPALVKTLEQQYEGA